MSYEEKINCFIAIEVGVINTDTSLKSESNDDDYNSM